MLLKFKIQKTLALFLLLLLTSCSLGPLSAFWGGSGIAHLSILSEVVNQNTLASVHVNAPDDHLHAFNPHGQRLYVSWSLPKKYLASELKGVLKVQFKIPEQLEIPFEITKSSGTMIYQIINEEYFQKEGILSYKIALFSNGKEIDHFEHKMWAELISFTP